MKNVLKKLFNIFNGEFKYKNVTIFGDGGIRVDTSEKIRSSEFIDQIKKINKMYESGCKHPRRTKIS